MSGEPCKGHTEDDRFECVSLEFAMDYVNLAVSYLVELSYTVIR